MPFQVICTERIPRTVPLRPELGSNPDVDVHALIESDDTARAFLHAIVRVLIGCSSCRELTLSH